MAREIKEVIAFHEALVGKQPEADSKSLQEQALRTLRSAVDAAQMIGALLPRLPSQDKQSEAKLEVSMGESGLLSTSQLVEREHEALKDFFGEEVPIAQPPELLLKAQEIAIGEGLGRLVPIYFVFDTKLFTLETDYPGWNVKPEVWFWDERGRGEITPDVLIAGDYWGLIDISHRPNYRHGRQMFADDNGLGSILKGLREDESIIVPHHLRNVVPDTSRFGISPNEQDKSVLPLLATRLRLTSEVIAGLIEVTRPTEEEFNFAGNLRYPYFGEVNSWEWFQNLVGGFRRVFGGHVDLGGLAYVDYRWPDSHADYAAFRPLVRFSPKLG